MSIYVGTVHTSYDVKRWTFAYFNVCLTSPKLIFSTWQLRLWECTNHSIQCLRILSLHESLISSLDVFGGRVLSRDIKGNTLVWDVDKALAMTTADQQQQENDDKKQLILKRCMSRRFYPFSRLAISDRHFVKGMFDKCLVVVDVWTGPKHDKRRSS